MKIILHTVSKRYNYDWIFRNLNATFSGGKKYAVTGPNGSGKSTLLKMLAGSLSPSEGKIIFEENDQAIPVENIYRYISYAAPYLDLIDAFTLEEMIGFHAGMKGLLPGIATEEVKNIAGLAGHSHKQLKYFSSGMKQKLKIALAILTDSKIILLDEPTTNLDVKSAAWYVSLLQLYAADRIAVIGSNMEREYTFCDERIDIQDFK